MSEAMLGLSLLVGAIGIAVGVFFVISRWSDARIDAEHRREVERLITFRRGPLQAFTIDASGEQTLCEYVARDGKKYRAGVGEKAFGADLDVLWEVEIP